MLTVPLSPQPPILPKVSHEGDTSNFDVYPEDDWKKDPPVPQKDLEIFKNFWSLSLLLYLLMEDQIVKFPFQELWWRKSLFIKGGCHTLSVIMTSRKTTSEWLMLQHVSHHRDDLLFYIFIYVSKVRPFFFFNQFFSEPAHMQKNVFPLKPKDCYFLGLKKENNQVFFYIIMFYMLSLFKMFMQSYLMWLTTGAVTISRPVVLHLLSCM